MNDVLSKFKNFHVLAIGDVFLDRFLEGESTRSCPEAPDAPVIDQTSEVVRPGGAANVAMNAAALGANSVTLVGVAGEDFEGFQLAGLLAEAEIIDRVTLVRDRMTLVKTRIMNGGKLLARLDQGDVGRLGEYVESDITIFLQSCWDRFDLVFVADYGKGTMTRAVIEEIASLQYRDRKTLVIDAKDLAKYRICKPTAVTPNFAEALELAASLGCESPFKREDFVSRRDFASTLGPELLEVTGAEVVAITLDEDGCVVLTPDHRPAKYYSETPIEPSHASGAGDSFAAAFGMTLAIGESPVVAMMLANLAASIVVAKPYTDVCSIDELAAQLNNTGQHHGPKARIVLAVGCFDVLHAGHVYLLERARMLGDKLIVAINSDESISRLKGCSRPVNTFADRARVLLALRFVDEVIYFNDDTPLEVIAMVRPSVYVKGDDYDRETLPEAELVENCGGECVFIPKLAGLSSSEVIRKCQTSCH